MSSATAPAGVTAGHPHAVRRARWAVARRVARNGPAMVGVVLVAIFVVVGFAGPVLAPSSPSGGNLADSLQLPGSSHLMGTDLQGRDELSRILYGARLSLEVCLSAVSAAALLGILVGALAGGIGGWVDAALMRLTDVLMAFPSILLAVGIVAWLGPGLAQITIAIAVSYAPILARLLRANMLAVAQADYVLAARVMGADQSRIILRCLLPNSITPVLVQAALLLGTAVIDVAGLGFLGLGPPDPSTPEWGTMLSDATNLLRVAPYLILFPAAAIVVASIGFNLLGDGLREALDPRMRR